MRSNDAADRLGPSAAHVVAAAAAALIITACSNARTGATIIEHDTTIHSADLGDDAGRTASVACGPRGLPPDRHFAGVGLCARVVANRQGALRGLTFAANGDLLAATATGEVRRYRDVDGDGIFAAQPPESIVWASVGDSTGNDCQLDGADLYCASRSSVKRWRYAPEIDHGGPGEIVVAGVPDGGRRQTLSFGIEDGFLIVFGGSVDEVVKRFSVAKLVSGRPLTWRDGEAMPRGRRNLPAGTSLGVAPAPKTGRFALIDRWRGGTFVALRGSVNREASTGHKVVWIPRDTPVLGGLPETSDAAPYEAVFGGGKYGFPRDGEWSWKVGDAGEDPVSPLGLAISPTDGALYVTSDNAGESTSSGTGASSGSIYRVALVGR